MRYPLPILMVLALVVNVHGQDRILDSLRNALDTTRQDTVQLRTLVSISQIASLSPFSDVSLNIESAL